MSKLHTEYGYIIYWQESGGSWYVAGFADPLMAVQTLEEAISVDGFVWTSDNLLRNLTAVRATEIREATVEYDNGQSWKSTLSNL